MGDKVTRTEAMVLLGLDPHNRASVTQFIKKGELTVYWGAKRDPTQKGRRRIQFFDTEEIDAILKKRAEIKAENLSTAKRVLVPGPTPRLMGGLPDAERQAEVKAQREAFLKETLNDAQTRALLGASAWELMQLAANGQIRTRRMMGEERYERSDVLAEQARRDAKRR